MPQLRSFLGLANQLGSFLPDLAHMTTPLRELLKKDTAFVWLPDHTTAFDKIKEVLLTSELLNRPFDPSLKTELYCSIRIRHGFTYSLAS